MMGNPEILSRDSHGAALGLVNKAVHEDRAMTVAAQKGRS
jgi:hypothetical protein